MKNRIKDYIFILYISLLPVTLALISLKLNNIGYFNTSPYYYIITLFTILMIITFVWSLIYILDDIIYKEEFMAIKNIKISILLLFSIFYPPFHYLFNYYKKLSFLSFLFLIINIFSLTFFINSFDNYVSKISIDQTRKSIVFATNYDYTFDNNRFKLNIDMDFSCDKKMGDYVFSCEDNKTDSFIGIYSYMINNYSDEELEDIYNYHLNQTISYITDAGYLYQDSYLNNVNTIKYNDMTIYMTHRDFDLDNDNINDVRLIIINESSIDDINNFYNLVYDIKLNH